MSAPGPSEIKSIITNSKEPLIFHNLLKWDILKWNLVDWNKNLGKEELQVRCGKILRTSEPQWERTTSIRKCTFATFLNADNIAEDEWLYFDYKYLNENLFGCEELKKHIVWEYFGYPDLNYKDSTIWIGSKGAHTPCHIDTYGCNLIAQVYGSKQWLICPPEENLYPTRIPYEESSIYSKINFFCPDTRQIENVSNARHVILNPGEVLLLPHGWWHYVENLETAISVNVWIPKAEDDEKRVEEAIARLIVSQIVKDLPPRKRSKILNPNMENEGIHQVDVKDTFAIIEQCLQTVSKERSAKKFRCDRDKTEDVEAKCEPASLSQYIKSLPKLSQKDVISWAEKQNSRFNNEPVFAISEQIQDATEKIVDAILHPEVLTLIKDKLMI